MTPPTVTEEKERQKKGVPFTKDKCCTGELIASLLPGGVLVKLARIYPIATYTVVNRIQHNNIIMI